MQYQHFYLFFTDLYIYVNIVIMYIANIVMLFLIYNNLQAGIQE
jgi:hypothetical protein